MTDGTRHSWRIGRETVIDLDRPHVLGIVNSTPDSFSGGGGQGLVEAVVGLALRLVDEGASVIDVGGESTRPGAVRVAAAEQIDRTLPVIEQLRACSEVTISIDTTRAAVAAAALDGGAAIVNDVSAGREDDGMFPLVAARGGGLILMHRRCAPGDDSFSDRYVQEPAYGDVAADVLDFLLDRCAAAEDAGVAGAAIVIDPGLGFGKSVEQNYELIRRTEAFVASGYPVLGAASRKSFIGAVTGVAEPRARMVGSAAVSVAQYLAGVRLFRAHDVARQIEALRVAEAIGAGVRSRRVETETAG